MQIKIWKATNFEEVDSKNIEYILRGIDKDRQYLRDISLICSMHYVKVRFSQHTNRIVKPSHLSKTVIYPINNLDRFLEFDF